jgi:hypothetical protein
MYNYTPETYDVSSVHNVAAVPYLHTVLHVMLFSHEICFALYNSTSRSMCAVPNVAVCCSSLISYFPGTLLMYCVIELEMVPVAAVVTGITFAFTLLLLLLLLLLLY